MQAAVSVVVDKPLSLKQVCELFFDNSITPATLKAEHRRGNLELFKIGRQYFTTRGHIEAMIEKCRLRALPRDRGSSAANWPEEVRRRAASAALRRTVENLKAAGRKKNK